MTEMREVWINDRWPLLLPEHRAARPVWDHWEAGRLASMWHHLGEPFWAHGHKSIAEAMAITFAGERSNGEVVYDIGSEEGDFPALFSSWGCDVVLFEPNDRVWPNIKAIWEANDLRPPLLAFSGFAGPETKISGVVVPDGFGTWPDAAEGEVIGDHGFCNLAERPDIPVVTIDDVVSFGVKPPTAITIDVEGAEFDVVIGAVDTLYTHRPKVWISIHRDFARDMYGHDDVLQDIRVIMLDCGYPDDGRGVFIASDHEEHWMWLP
jgi:FkbM family methyltransferase